MKDTGEKTLPIYSVFTGTDGKGGRNRKLVYPAPAMESKENILMYYRFLPNSSQVCICSIWLQAFPGVPTKSWVRRSSEYKPQVP